MPSPVVGATAACHHDMKLCSTTLALTLVATLMALAPRVLASPRDDLAFEVSENNHDKTSGWIIERLVTLEVDDACWAKILDKKNNALSRLASDARYIERVAKALTGDEWSSIETQGANNRDANRAIVDKMITAFEPKFHLTVRIDGAGCDAGGSSLWLKYVSSAVISLSKYTPKSGQMKLAIQAGSAKGLRAEMNKGGTELVIVGSRDIEAAGWSDTIEKALKRVSTKN
jgi:hypothetical protein